MICCYKSHDLLYLDFRITGSFIRYINIRILLLSRFFSILMTNICQNINSVRCLHKRSSLGLRHMRYHEYRSPLYCHDGLLSKILLRN